MNADDRPAEIAVVQPIAPGRLRLRLADLLAWVPGVAIVATLWRHARPTKWFGATTPDSERIVGLSAATLAIFLGIGLLRQSLLFYRRWRAGEDLLLFRLIFWRLLVTLLLVLFVTEEGRLLDEHTDWDGQEGPETRILRSVLPATATLGLAGLVGSLNAGRSRPRRRRLAWFSVLWAGTAGILITATQLLIPFLVIIAIEHVKLARFHPERSQMLQGGLYPRMIHGGIAAVPALCACLLLGLRLSHELCRAPGAEDPRATTQRQLNLALLTLIVAVLSGILFWKTLPAVSESMAEGLRLSLSGSAITAIVLGFAGLALALAVRSTDRPQEPVIAQAKVRPWYRYLAFLFSCVAAMFLLDVIVTRLLTVFQVEDHRVWNWLGWTESALQWVYGKLPQSFWSTGILSGFESPLWFVLLLAQLWIAWHVLSLLVVTPCPTRAPIDLVFSDSTALRRFSARWVALTVLMLAAMPVLFLEGLAIFAYLLRATGR